MHSTGFDEGIRHFLGYLHIADALAHLDATYEGARFQKITIELVVTPPPPSKPYLDVEDLDSRPVRISNELLVEQMISARTPPMPQEEDDVQGFLQGALRAIQTRPPAIADIAVRRDGAASREISVEYDDRAMQLLNSITQVNRMIDDDVVSAGEISVWNGHAWAAGFAAAGSSELLQDLMKTAQDYTPSDIDISPASDTAELIGFISARDAMWAEDRLPDRAPVEPGRYVDGVRSDEAPPSPVLAPSIDGIQNAEWITIDGETSRTITGPSDGIGTVVHTGGNEATNAAVIRDLGGQNGSMIIKGDAYHTNAIVQVNLLVDSDKIDLVIGAGLDPMLAELTRSASADGNTAHNIAEFVHHDYSAVLRGAAFMPQWTVDVVDGDFYSVRALSQVNYNTDHDRVSQYSDTTFQQLRTGDNQQINITSIYDFNQYDLVIIGGSYHSANWIFQKNIVVDNDWITSRLDGEDGSRQSAYAGGNSLLNEARITTYGNQDYLAINDAQRDLLSALERGDTTLQPHADWQLAGSATGALRVLYINGDYYDLNLISQTNIISDIDQVAQWTSNDGAAVQGAVTGQNAALNNAQIIDVGTLSGSSYLGGDPYEDSILIQANFVVDEPDQVTIHANGYVPELIAFAQHGDETADQGQISAPTKICDPSHYDNPGSVLT
jgi:hypothetical protein